MRVQFGILILCLCSPAAAQYSGGRGGGMSHGNGGQNGNGPVPPIALRQPIQNPSVVATYLGSNPLWGSVASPSFSNPSSFFLPFSKQNFVNRWGFPAYVGSYSEIPNGYYYGGFGAYGAGFYPPQPPAAPANVTVVLPPQPQSVVIIPGQSASPARNISAPDESVVMPAPTIAAVPPRENVAPDESPALVAIKDGNIYSVDRYWIKGGILHFVATNGEEHQVPMSRVESLYPARKSASKAATSH